MILGIKKKSKIEWATILTLIVLNGFMIWVNTQSITNWNIPIGHDEVEFMGTARQIVFFKTVPYIEARTLRFFSFSAIIGMISWLLPFTKMVYIYRAIHLIVISGLVWNFYRWGAVKSKLFGLFMAAGITLFSVSGYVYNFGSFVPTVVIYFLVPLIFKNLMSQRYGWTAYWLIWATLIHVWFVPPILMIAFFYEVFRRNVKWGIALMVVALVSAISVHDFLVEKVGDLLFLREGGLTWKFEDILPLLIFGITTSLFILVSKNLYKEWRSLFWMGVSLIISFVFGYLLMGNSYGLIKLQFFLFWGLTLLTLMGLAMLTRKVGYKKAAFFLVPLIVFQGINVAKENKDITHNTVPVFMEEIKAFDWMAENTDIENSIVLSDWGTMLVTHYYIPIKNSIQIDTWMFDQAWNGNQPKDFTQDFREIYDFFVAPEMSDEYIEWLKTQKKQYDASDVYLMITPRSRQNLYYYTFYPDQWRGMATSPDANYVFEGVEKFYEDPLFKLVYENSEVQIFSVDEH